MEKLGVIRLEGAKNWSVWRFQMAVILREQGLYQVVTNPNLKPSNGSAAAATKPDEVSAKPGQASAEPEQASADKDLKAMSAIVTRLAEPVLHQVITCQTAHEVWNRLHSIYEKSGETSLMLQQQRFFALKFENDMSVADFISKVQEQQQILRRLGEAVTDRMAMSKIIMSLPPKYSHFVSAWESCAEEKQTVDNLTARLLVEEERLNNKSSSKVDESVALFSKGQKGKNKGNYKCFLCNKSGHLKKDCKLKDVCFNCQKPGHFKDKCKATKNNKKTENAFVSKVPVSASDRLIDEKWLVDSGASHHMTYQKELFCEYERLSTPKVVMIGDGRHLNALGIGKIKLMAFDGEEYVSCSINNVLHVPKLKINLFSVGSVVCNGFQVSMTNDQCVFSKDNRVCAIANKESCSKLYVMDFKSESLAANVAKLELSEWHERLVHQNYKEVKRILKKNNIDFSESPIDTCTACVQGKQHRLPFDSSRRSTSKTGELVHADLCGPIEEKSIGGSRYFLLLKDDFSNYRTIYFLTYKSETVEKIKEFIMRAKTLNNPVCTLRSDNGTEFVNAEMKTLLAEHGVTHETTVPYCPEQNGKAERDMRTLVEGARTLLHAKRMDKVFWAEAINTVVYTLNRTYHSKEEGKTPYESWSGNKFDVNGLHTFGSEVFVHIPKEKRRKFDAKGEKGIFVGYGEYTKGFRIYFPRKNAVEVVRDVTFVKKHDKPEKAEQEEECIYLDIEENLNNEEYQSVSNTEENEEFEDCEESDNIMQEVEFLEEEIIEDEEIQEVNDSRRTRSRKAPNWFDDYEVGFISMHNEPSTLKEAMECEDKENWIEAMNREITTLKENNTWSEVAMVPKGIKVINSKWVYRIKENPSQEIQYKARLVARGFEQTDMDGAEVYAPVASLTSFRTLLAVAVKKKLPVYQMDVTGAFLYGDIDEPVYMKLPNGGIGKLNKSIYGLKKSPKYWNRKFNDFMCSDGFIKSKNDPCLYFKCCKEYSIYVLIFVDDLLYFSDSDIQIRKFKEKLCKNFAMKDLGMACNYLGISIEQDVENGKTVINQKDYLLKVLRKYGMSDCKACNIPIDQNFKFELLRREKSESKEIELKCRQIIGNLLYASNATRPDLCVAIGFLSRYQHCASMLLLKCLQRVLRYVKGTVDLSLVYGCNGNDKLEGYVDADWAGDTKDRKSTSGYIFKVFDCVISWCTKKQLCVSLSSTEAEYVALCLGIVESCLLKNLLLDFGFKLEVKINEDNQSVIKIAENNFSNKRLKHIDVKYHFIIEKINDGCVSLSYVSSSDNLGDMFTKALGGQLYVKLRSKILK